MSEKKEFIQEKMQIANMIKRVRAYANLSQRELSRLTGVSQSDISRLERGLANPSLYTISRIMSATGTSLSFDYSVVGKSDACFIEGWKSKIDDSIVAAVKNLSELVVDSIGDDISKVILFGSCARGDNTEESDIDIALLLKSDADKNEKYGQVLAEITSDIMDKYQALVNFICIPFSQYEKKKTWYGLYKNINNEGIVIYG